MRRIVTLLFVLLGYNAMAQSTDTVLSVNLPRVTVDAKRNWANDTVQYRYNQMKYYVTTILPYLNAATAMMDELNRKEQDPNISKRERKDFVNRKEDEIRTRFENEISKLNETQGVLLVKLIARQSGENIYGKMEEYKNTFYAMKWQAWARFHGFNLNRRYDPYEEPMLEHIMQSLGYELPAKYGEYEARLNTH
eukprot:TRINITY_DN40482_c0_g1_i1.p1 TRINITY_DN40482_c0_g1~~TRINITY_DN40482_c0_g1_i1.p1  ORF type:complete len:194 (+),score=25.03 TRINITY_DN40482_c0_g1_i1:47-628(+)